MPGETTHYKIKYSSAADETKAFPTEVSKPGAETIDKELWEGNKVAAGEVYGSLVTRTKAALEAGIEPSATRATLVMFVVTGEVNQTAICTIKVGSVSIAATQGNGNASGSTATASFIVPAGKTYSITAGAAHVELFQTSYLPL